MNTTEQPRFMTDFQEIIDFDSWAWGVIWGEARVGKSTMALLIALNIYGNEQDALGCFVWNLSELIYKIKHGLPKRFPTRNSTHMRVPLLIYDDFGSTGNKAATRSDPSWDSFKSCFDTLGVKLAVLLGTMQSATNPTSQLQEKFSHEIWIPARGYWKYDRIKTHQNYRGWQPQVHKDWQDEGTFLQVSKHLYEEYDSQRVPLADEAMQRVEDVMADTHVDSILKRINSMDLNLLQAIKRTGPMYVNKIKEEFGDSGKEALMRSKSRQLIVMRKYGDHYYKADITDLGLEVLKAVSQPEGSSKKPTIEAIQAK